MIQFKVNRASFREVKNNVEWMMQQVQRRAIKDALMKAATPAVKDAKQRVPRRTGLLRRAIKKRGRTYRPRGMAFVIVGPDRRTIGADAKGAKVWPVKYAHLIEFGHAKKGGGRVGPRPFLRPAFMANKENMKRIYGAEIGPAVERQAARAAKRQRRRA